MPDETARTTLLSARSAFADISVSPSGYALSARECDGRGIASVSVRRGQREALAQRITRHFGVVLPDGPRRAVRGNFAAAGTGPGTWLMSYENAGNAFIPELKSVIADSAALVDQSDAYAIIRLSGNTLRETLMKLVSIDIHPRAFRVGDVAGTLLGHMGVLLWRLEDSAEGEPVVEIAGYRSMAADLWHALSRHAPDLAD